MLCSNCGKSVPFVGKVCPHCGIDKSRDQAIQVWGCIGLLAGGGLGWAMTADIWLTLLIAISGGIAGIAFASRRA